MDAEAFDSENASSRSLKILLLVLVPGALIVAFSLDSSVLEVGEITQVLIQVVMNAGFLMIIHVIQGIFYFVPTPIECFSKFLFYKVHVFLLVLAWSCSFVYRLIKLVAFEHDGDGASNGDNIVGRPNQYLELWLVQFEAELRRGNYSNPAVVAAHSVHLLPQTPPQPSHQD